MNFNTFIKVATFTFCFVFSMNQSFAQAVGEPEIVNPHKIADFKPKLSVSGNFDTDKFLVEYRLPVDTKKLKFEIITPDGKTIVKENYGKDTAGYHKFFYNIKYEPKGVYTFIISTKEGYMIKQKFEKKGKA